LKRGLLKDGLLNFKRGEAKGGTLQSSRFRRELLLRMERACVSKKGLNLIKLVTLSSLLWLKKEQFLCPDLIQPSKTVEENL